MQLRCNTKELRGMLRYKQALKDLNAWRVGGVSDCFYIPADLADLSFFLEHCAGNQQITCLGMGSNVLVRDNGISGIVLSFKGVLDDIRRLGPTQIRAEAGVACAKLAQYCAKQGLAGLEFLAGVPGTVGGALAMNAGAYGSEIWQYTTQAELIGRDGEIRLCQAEEFTPGYREVGMPVTDAGVSDEQWFIAGYFSLTGDGDPEQLRQRIKQLLQERNDAQPIGEANCGSVFRNPPDDYAARLVETCGLKGYVLGGAQVSCKHANFIVNNGSSNAADIEALIRYIQATVMKKTGVKLIPEIKFIGD